MTTEANPVQPAAPAAPPVNVQPPAPPPAPAVQPDPNAPPENEPAWLGERLKRAEKAGEKKAVDAAKKSILAELGVEDPDAIKKIVAEDKKRAEEKKSVEQKLAERDAKEAERQAELKLNREAVKTLADEQIANLSEEQKNAVLAVAGEDPARQIKAIAALRPTWTKSAPAAQSPANGAQPAAAPAPVVQPPAPPANTAPPAGAPPPAGGVVVDNHLATFEHLQKVAPVNAALYFAKFGPAIVAARKARGG